MARLSFVWVVRKSVQRVGQKLESLQARLPLTHRERLLEKPVIIGLIDNLKNFLKPNCATDGKRLNPMVRLRRRTSCEQERRETAEMVQMKMADPDRIEIGPVKFLLGHAMRHQH